MDTAIKLFRRFLDEELEKYRLNVRQSNDVYKFSTVVLREYFAKYVGEDRAAKCVIALTTGHIEIELMRSGFEIVERRRGVFIVRRVKGDADGR